MKQKQPIPELVKRRMVDITGYTLAEACYLCMYHTRKGHRHFCMKHQKYISELCVCPNFVKENN